MAIPPPPGSVAAYPTPPMASSSASNNEGVTHLKIGSILGLLVQALLWIGILIFILIYQAIQNNTTVFGTASTLPSWITPGTVWAALGAIAAAFFVGIISFIFFYLGFRAVKRGAPDFGAPTILMLIGLIGFLMAAIGALLVVGGFVDAVNNAVNATGNGGVALGTIVAGLGLIGLGGLLGLIGVIGLVLGNWRAGKRYDESTLKIGAILSILPYVSIVGYILLFVGYMRAGSKLKTGWMPQGGMGQMPPPGYYAPPPPPPPPMQ